MDVLLLREVRYIITEVREFVYKQQWNKIYNIWGKLDGMLSQIIVKDSKYYWALYESRVSAEQGNYLRLYDLLVFEIDFFIAGRLSELSEIERKDLAEAARKENEAALSSFHENIFALMNKEKQLSRIECSYAGTENVNIYIKEGNEKFQLFSSRNPWLESANFIMGKPEDLPDEIYVLGFGGGYLIKALSEKYPSAIISIYLPNIDIFRAVVSHISAGSVLRNPNIHFFSDPTCIELQTVVKSKLANGNNFEVYIDRQELRACVGDADVANRLLADYKRRMLQQERKKSFLTNSVGKEIYKYIVGKV